MRAPWLLLPITLATGFDPGQDGVDFERDVRAPLERHCVACHGGEHPKGALDLTREALPDADALDAFDWDVVREVVRAREMPPVGHPPLDPDELERLVAFVDALHPRQAEGPIDPGPAPLRRLNGRELTRALRDGLGIELDATAFLGPDPVGLGFDTAGQVLALPAERVERMLALAERAASLAFPHDDPRVPAARHFSAEAFSARRTSEGIAVLSRTGDATVTVWAPRSGRYRLTASLSASRAGDQLARAKVRVDGETVGKAREIAARRDAPEDQVWEFELVGGRRELAVNFPNDFYDPDHPEPSQRDRNLHIHHALLEGPLDPAQPTALQRELAARAERAGRSGPRGVLAELGHHLWRRPLTEPELDRLLGLTGEDEPEALRLQVGATALLASPYFHLRVEGLADEPGSAGVVRLSGEELATRLALFLWSSLPDRELLEAAARGDLDSDAGLAAQVERMLADPRARVLAEAFGLAWLGVPALADHRPDPVRFRGWGPAIARSAREETRRVLEELLFEDRPLTDLVAADWTWIDRRLARFYRLELFPAGEWRRVSLADTPRRGVLGHASVLTVTSNPARTSIPRRGKWVLEALLGTAPPDPPPGADSLAEDEASLDLTLRERLELHRENPDCFACHAALDPIGFGLERFDAVGRVRAGPTAADLDTSGELPDGRRFEGPVELSALLAAEPGLTRQVVERLVVFALGRGLTRADRPAIDAVLTRLDPARPTMGQALRAVCVSPLMTHRRAGGLAPTEEGR